MRTLLALLVLAIAPAACGTGQTEPAPDAALPACPPDATGFCDEQGVCTVDGVRCIEAHHGIDHPDAGP